jgi:EAL domain-containing protein (putative c-di-GMP-specific phosphodiesterase class I)/GGDEF domain-containing protein
VLSRSEFFDLVDYHVSQRTEASGPLGMIHVRIKGFREFRIGHGYSEADQLIDASGGLIAKVLGPSDIVCQTGDAEFSVLLPGLRSRNHGLLAANRLVRAFQRELELDGRPLPMALSIGLAFHPEHGVTAESLCRHADLGSDVALGNEHDLLRHFAEQIPEDELREAIVNNRFELYLQPVWDIETERVVAAESLARWYSPLRGVVEPSLFVPLAERNGLIVEFSRWSLHTTLRACALARGVDPTIQFAFNLSARILAEHDIVEQILSAMRLWEVAPDALVLEVTESAIMQDPAMGTRVLQKLRDAGLGIAIDDFGTGYSALSYLKNIPATELKIDQTFVRDLREDRRTVQLVRSIIDLAHHLQIKVVAEGVEDAQTLQILIGMGCNRAQGYHIGAPIPAADFITTINRKPKVGARV